MTVSIQAERSHSFETMEDGRYCEVLVVRMQDDPLADVYNSLPFGSCPQELWEALDADVIKQDLPGHCS